MEISSESYKNNLGIWGFIYAGKYSIERYLYILHRLTGLGILLYFILHIFVSSTRISGENAWNNAMAFVDSPLFKFGEYLVFAAFIFHAINGLRLFFNELGLGIGEPIPPIFPYSDCLKRHRYVIWICGIIFVCFACIAFWDMFIS